MICLVPEHANFADTRACPYGFVATQTYSPVSSGNAYKRSKQTKPKSSVDRNRCPELKRYEKCDEIARIVHSQL